MRKTYKLLSAAIMALMLHSCTSNITIENQSVEVDGYKNSNITVSGSSTVELTSSSPDLLQNSTISLDGDDAWLLLPNISRNTWQESALAESILINGEPLKIGDNAHLINYYNGVYVKPAQSQNYTAATLYNANGENRAEIKVGEIYKGDNIPLGDDMLSSFNLKRGHMMVIAENSDGTGASNTYIAVSEDINIALDDNLREKVSFLRITPWNYTTKRGAGGNISKLADLDVNWYYNWGSKDAASHSMDYAPMFWGGSSKVAVEKVLNDQYTNHILAFNEPDGRDQANISPQEALRRYPPLLGMGLRIGSPACKESNWKSWLSEFMEGCEKNGYRVDFIATHWYDWGDWGKSKDAEPQDIEAMVARFKRDIDMCYAKYGLPIWITEFNANRNRVTSVQIEFLKLAIPMLEAHPHVERYAFFQPFGGMGDFVKDGELTQTADAYCSMVSTPAVTQSKRE